MRISRGGYGEQYFTLSSTYFQGRSPKSVNFYWRRFRVADIPLEDQDKFELWLRERWYEKDELLEQYLTTGRFPPSPVPEKQSPKSAGAVSRDYVETEVRTRYWWEWVQIFVVVGAFGLVGNVVARIWERAASILA